MEQKKKLVLHGQEIPEYSGRPYVRINGNQPELSADGWDGQPSICFETLPDEEQDGTVITRYRATACISGKGGELEERGSLAEGRGIAGRPKNTQLELFEASKKTWLYNRCHLIARQLGGKNENNRVWGTHYMNESGMQPFEKRIADHLAEKDGNCALYRVTEIRMEGEPIARGVQMEALLMEADGTVAAGKGFNVFAYSVQPGVDIDYKDGSYKPDERYEGDEKIQCVLNMRSRVYHWGSACEEREQMASENRHDYDGSKRLLEDVGYRPCKNCKA